MNGPADHVYKKLTGPELARLRKQESGTGGGAQNAMYQLSCRVTGTTLRCEDWLYQKILGIVTSSSFGGYQDRLPFEMHIQMLKELGRPADVETVHARRRQEAAVLPF